jgi:hypothetical protein
MNLHRAFAAALCLSALAAAPPARKEAPKFWALNASGDAVHLSDRTPRCRWVLVEFWSSGKRRAEDQKVMAKLREKYLSDDRLLLFSVCVDLDFGDWLGQMNRQKSLSDGKGGEAPFYGDRHWWQLSLGVRRDEDRAAFARAHGLGKGPSYYLVRPGGALQAGKIPPERLKEALAEALGAKGERE